MQGTNNKKREVFNASDYHVGIVVADFNTDITSKLLDEARNLLQEYSVPSKAVDVMHVPGSIEIPLVLQNFAKTKKYDCLVALGAVVRGESAHFEYVAKFVTEGILKVQLDHNISIGFGVLTTFDHDQAIKRIHAGRDAAIAALHVAREVKKLSS